MDQKTNSLADWFADTVKKKGIQEAERLRSSLSVKKSTRYYNTKNRVMPGTVFIYKGKRYILISQISKGKYYQAYGMGDINFPVAKVQILLRNGGLVFAAYGM